MSGIQARIQKLESASGISEARVRSVRFVDAPGKAHTPSIDDLKTHALWGSGPDTWRIYVKPRQSEDSALRQADLDPSKDKILFWGSADNLVSVDLEAAREPLLTTEKGQAL